jgi:plastocyanin
MRWFRLATVSFGSTILLAASVVAADFGTIQGQILLPNAPAAKPVDVTVDKDFCKSKGPVVQEDLIVSKDGGVQYVMVWLRPDSPDRKAPFPADQIHPDLAKAAPVKRIIDQPCCQFIPRVLVARAGDTLEVKNSAQVNHNINYNSDAESFNVNIPPGKSHIPAQPLAAQSTPITFKCDVHPWMQGRIRVFDHPYFAVTDANGNFEIKNAPYGKWRLVIQHENGYHMGRQGALGMPIEIKEAVTKVPAVNLQLPGAAPVSTIIQQD